MNRRELLSMLAAEGNGHLLKILEHRSEDDTLYVTQEDFTTMCTLNVIDYNESFGAGNPAIFMGKMVIVNDHHAAKILPSQGPRLQGTETDMPDDLPPIADDDDIQKRR